MQVTELLIEFSSKMMVFSFLGYLFLMNSILGACLERCPLCKIRINSSHEQQLFAGEPYILSGEVLVTGLFSFGFEQLVIFLAVKPYVKH